MLKRKNNICKNILHKYNGDKRLNQKKIEKIQMKGFIRNTIQKRNFVSNCQKGQLQIPY